MASPAPQPTRELCYSCTGTGERTPPVKGQSTVCPRCKGTRYE